MWNRSTLMVCALIIMLVSNAHAKKKTPFRRKWNVIVTNAIKLNMSPYRELQWRL